MLAMRRTGSLLAAFAVALSGIGITAVAAAPAVFAAEASEPGSAKGEPAEIFWEGFENRENTGAPLSLEDYEGGEGTNNDGMKYTAEENWLRQDFCNGVILDGNDPLNDTDYCNRNFHAQLLSLLNQADEFQGTALSAYTSANKAGATFGTDNAINPKWTATPYGAVQLRTSDDTPINIGRENRFLTVGVDAAALNCYYEVYQNNPTKDTEANSRDSHPALVFSYIDGDGPERLVSTRLGADGTILDNTVNNGVVDFTSPVVLPTYLQDFKADPTGTQEMKWRLFFNNPTQPKGIEGVDYVKHTSTPNGKYTWYTPIDPDVINPCADGTMTTVAAPANVKRDLRSGSYMTNSAFLNESSELQLIMRNLNPTGFGNDGAVDNLRVWDVTPSLDVHYGVWNTTDGDTHEGTNVDDRDTLQYGELSTITYTISNTTELSSKYGWGFTNTLPDDLEFATDESGALIAPTMTCDGVTQADGALPTQVTLSDKKTITVTDGYLAKNTNSCKITAQVKPTVDPFENTLNDSRENHRTYTTEPASFTELKGLNEPNPTTITWYNAPKVDVAKSVSTAGPYVVGDEVTFTLSVTNTGKSAFTAETPFVVWDDFSDLADHAEFVKLLNDVPAGDSAFVTGTKIKWTGVLAPKETKTLQYTMRITSNAEGSGSNIVFAPTGSNRTSDNPATPTCAVVDGDDETTGESCAKVSITVTQKPTTLPQPTKLPKLAKTGVDGLALLLAGTVALGLGGAALALRRRQG